MQYDEVFDNGTLAMMLVSGTYRISTIDRSGSWYYMYDENGKKYKTLSVSSVGDIVGYSSTFFVSTRSSWIYLWDSEWKKYKTLSASSIGQVIGVTGDTFTSP